MYYKCEISSVAKFNNSQTFGKLKLSLYYLRGYLPMSLNYHWIGNSPNFLHLSAFALCQPKIFMLKMLAKPQ